MKKLMSILLCVALLMGVCAAANAATGKSETIRSLLRNDGEDEDYEEEISTISDYLNDAKNGHAFSRWYRWDGSLKPEPAEPEPIEKIDKQADKVNEIIKHVKEETYPFDQSIYDSVLDAAETAVDAELIEHIASLEPYNGVFRNAAFFLSIMNHYSADRCKALEEQLRNEYSAGKEAYLNILKALDDYIKTLH